MPRSLDSEISGELNEGKGLKPIDNGGKLPNVEELPVDEKSPVEPTPTDPEKPDVAHTSSDLTKLRPGGAATDRLDLPKVDASEGRAVLLARGRLG